VIIRRFGSKAELFAAAVQRQHPEPLTWQRTPVPSGT
jgi:hypothetical protein